MSVRGVLAVILALLAASPVAAQSTLDDLRRATELMQAADQYFHRRTTEPSSEQALDAAYRQISESISLFARAAPSSRIDKVLREVQQIYGGLRLPQPSTLSAAAEDCDGRRDPMLARYLSGVLRGKFLLTLENAEAEAKFGPLAENPAFYASIRPPATAVDLLTNLKWAFDHDALVREDFFAPSTLRKVFGVDVGLQRLVNGNVSNFAIVKATAAEFRALDPASRAYGQFCTYHANRYVKAAGKANGSLSIDCTFRRTGMPSFEEVEQVFGPRQPHSPLLDVPSPHGPPRQPVYVTHGNEKMQYDFSDTDVNRSLLVKFAPDASFAWLYMTMEER